MSFLSAIAPAGEDRYGAAGLPPDTIHVKFDGHAGQSFGFTLAKGVFLEVITGYKKMTGCKNEIQSCLCMNNKTLARNHANKK